MPRTQGEAKSLPGCYNEADVIAHPARPRGTRLAPDRRIPGRAEAQA
jgi:hypothetical protein